MSRPIISVDIDDVLSHSAKAMVAYGNERWGHNLTLDDFNEDLATMWQVDRDEAEQRWQEYMETGSMSKYEGIPEALDALQKLSQTYRIIAVTSRRDTLLPITEEWIQSNYPGIFEEVVGAGIYGTNRVDSHKLTKAEVLKRVGSAYHIDDQPKHCLGAASVSVVGILFGGYAWNRDIELPDGVVRCNDWAEVLAYFDGRD